MTDIVKDLRDLAGVTNRETRQTMYDAADEIERLRAGIQATANAMAEQVRTIRVLRAENEILAGKVGKLEAECFSLSAWQCVYTDGKTGLVGDEHGNQYCAMTKEADRLRAEKAELVKALQWYAEGGEFRLGFDNGDIARTALAKMEGDNE